MNPDPGRSLCLQTYDGCDIANQIDAEPSANWVAMTTWLYRGLQRRRLSPATGRYNCHGLVFASRRTGIPRVGVPVDIDGILRRDRYHRVESPSTGDVVVYRSPAHEIEHTGIVSRVERIHETSQAPVVYVWSKWGYFEECEHLESVSPYSGTTVEYWRLG